MSQAVSAPSLMMMTLIVSELRDSENKQKKGTENRQTDTGLIYVDFFKVLRGSENKEKRGPKSKLMST